MVPAPLAILPKMDFNNQVKSVIRTQLLLKTPFRNLFLERMEEYLN